MITGSPQLEKLVLKKIEDGNYRPVTQFPGNLKIFTGENSGEITEIMQ
jgi:hypothetical protein